LPGSWVLRSAEGALTQRLRDADTCQRRDPMSRRTTPTVARAGTRPATTARRSRRVAPRNASHDDAVGPSPGGEAQAADRAGHREQETRRRRPGDAVVVE